jgi:hypothetical protein
MSTELKDQTTVEAERKPGRMLWLWGLVAALVIVAVAVFVVSSRSSNNNNQGYNATTDSVHNAATGSQGSVGNFREQVIPDKTGATTGTSGITGTPTNTLPGTIQRAPADKAVPGSGSTGDDMGSGNTGVGTATDSVGGAPMPNANPSKTR